MLPIWMAMGDDTPYWGDPWRALAVVVDRYAALGLTPVITTELEFHLVDPEADKPAQPRSPITGRLLEHADMPSIDEPDAFEAFLGDIHAACAARDIQADAAISETRAGQFEVNLTHVPDPLKAAGISSASSVARRACTA